MKRLIKVLLFAATMMFVAGCITDRFFLDPPDPSDTDVDVLLKLKTPGGMSNPRTRALSYDDENTIEDIFVLVFQNDILNSIKIGESVDWESTPSAGGDSSVRYSGEGSFEVTLRQSRGESDRYKLMVLANLGEVDGMRDILDGLLLARAGYPDVLAALSIGVTGPLYAEGGTIPMWGEKSDVVVMPSNNELEVELMRSVARIDVGVGAKPTIDNPLTDAWRWDGMEPDGTTPIPFVLTEVYVMQPGNLFSVIPAPGNVKAPSGESPGEVTAPTIPGGTSPVPPAGSEKYSYFKFSDGDITGGKYTTRSIYVPESDVLMTRSGLSESEQHISRMALVVGGIFNDDPEGTTYYRIDFSDGGGMMDVLRNHLYQFSISKVLGPGRPTVEEAYEASAMKMEVNIIDWNEIGLGNIWVLGDMWFSISDLEVMFTPLDQQTARVKISTNVPDFAMSLGGEERLVAGRVTSWESDYYSYKLIEDRENAYTLEISTLSSNVSQSSLEAASRLEEWFIDVGWVSNIGFKVDQGWQSTYISVINGQTSYLYPEGAVGEEALSLDIVSSKPVTITVEPESAAGSGGWIGGLVSELPQTMGIWSANMRLEVSPLAHDPSHPEETSRTATIHIAVGDETPIAYTVTQESPYLSLTSSDLVIDRSGATTQKVAGWVTVQTNLPADHLDLAVGQMSGLGVIPLSLVSSSSRNLSFGVEVDADDPEEGFTTTFSVTPREGGAEAIPDYGMDGVSGTIMVRNANDVFRFLWRGGAFRGNGPDEWPWTPATGDQDADRRMDYIFPWSTERVKFDLISNIGGTLLAPDLITGGSLESGDPTTEVDVSTTPWVFTFSDDHTALLTPTFTLMSRSISTYIIVGFSRGPQEWAFDEGFDASWGYTGTGGAGSSSPLTVRSNISWGASSDQEWLTLKTGGGALASSAMRDDHTGFTAPVYPLEDETPAQTRARLTTAGPLDVHIDPITTLNDLAGSNYRRHAAVTFTNRSEGGTNLSLGERTLIVTQHSPVLQPKSNTIPIPAGEVEHTGGKVDFIATTNLAGWGVRIYSNTDNEGAITPDPRLLTTGGEWPFTGEANIDATTAPDPNGHRVSVTVPQYRGATPRELIFHLYCTEFPDTEIEAGRATQLSGIPSANILWFDEDGKLQVGKWGIDFTASDYRHKIAFFRFGSVVGFDINSTWDTTVETGSIHFNPTAQVYEYTDIPYYLSTEGSGSGWWSSAAASPSVSSPRYHNVDNLLVGKGDPCKLIGLTVAEIGSALSGGVLPPDSGWRTPTASENSSFVSGAIYSVGTWGAGTPGWVTFPAGEGIQMPAAGYRSTSGVCTDPGVLGWYWSSTPQDALSGNSLGFQAGAILSAGEYTRGHAVRCVEAPTPSDLGIYPAALADWSPGENGDDVARKVTVYSNVSWSVRLEGDDAGKFTLVRTGGTPTASFSGQNTVSFTVYPLAPNGTVEPVEATIVVDGPGILDARMDVRQGAADPWLEIPGVQTATWNADVATPLNINVTSNVTWTASITGGNASDKFRLTTDSGGPGGAFSIEPVETNGTISDRTVEVTVAGSSGGTLTERTITLTHKAAPASIVVVPTPTATLAAFSATDSNNTTIRTFTVTANVPWEVSIEPGADSDGVFDYSPKSGTADPGVPVTVTVWPTRVNGRGDITRRATLTVKGTEAAHTSLGGNLLVSQNPANSEWDVEIDDNTSWLPGASGIAAAKTLTISSNVPWSVTDISNSTDFVFTPANPSGTGSEGSPVSFTVHPKDPYKTLTTARSVSFTVNAVPVGLTDVPFSLSQSGVSFSIYPTTSTIRSWGALDITTETITVTANIPWDASFAATDSGWFNMTEKTGTAGTTGGSFRVAPKATNGTTSERPGKIDIRGTGVFTDVATTLDVKQNAASASIVLGSLTPSTAFAYGDQGNTASTRRTFTVTANVPWSVSIDGPNGTDFDYEPKSGTSQPGVPVTVSVWPKTVNGRGDVTRSATLTVSGSGESESISVSQSNPTPAISWTTTPAPAVFAADGPWSAQTLSVTANIPWEVEVVDGTYADQFTITPSANAAAGTSGTFTIVPKSNNTDVSMARTISIRARGRASAFNGTATSTFNVIQSAATPVLTVNTTSLSTQWEAEDSTSAIRTVSITASNCPWEAIAPAGFLLSGGVSRITGTGTSPASFTVYPSGPNTNISGAKTGTLTIRTTSGTPQVSHTPALTQKVLVPYITPEPATVAAWGGNATGNGANAKSFTVSSNVTWSLDTSGTWAAVGSSQSGTAVTTHTGGTAGVKTTTTIWAWPTTINPRGDISRSATITLSGTGTYTATKGSVGISQGAAALIWTVNGSSAAPTAQTWATGTMETRSFVVNSNIPWSVALENQSEAGGFILEGTTSGDGSGGTFTIRPKDDNLNPSVRSATVRMTRTGQSALTFTLNQASGAYFTLTPDAGSTISFEAPEYGYPMGKTFVIRPTNETMTWTATLAGTNWSYFRISRDNNSVINNTSSGVLTGTGTTTVTVYPSSRNTSAPYLTDYQATVTVTAAGVAGSKTINLFHARLVPFIEVLAPTSGVLSFARTASGSGANAQYIEVRSNTRWRARDLGWPLGPFKVSETNEGAGTNYGYGGATDGSITTTRVYVWPTRVNNGTAIVGDQINVQVSGDDNNALGITKYISAIQQGTNAGPAIVINEYRATETIMYPRLLSKVVVANIDWEVVLDNTTNFTVTRTGDAGITVGSNGVSFTDTYTGTVTVRGLPPNQGISQSFTVTQNTAMATGYLSFNNPIWNADGADVAKRTSSSLSISATIPWKIEITGPDADKFTYTGPTSGTPQVLGVEEYFSGTYGPVGPNNSDRDYHATLTLSGTDSAYPPMSYVRDIIQVHATPLASTNQGDILYLDGDALRIGKWSGAGGPVTLSNIAYFKYGGVIGLNPSFGTIIDDTPAGSNNRVRFNPASGISISSSGSTNRIPTSPPWKSPGDPLYVFQAEYNTLANIHKGLGDPCQLVGLSSSAIRNFTSDAQLQSALNSRAAADKGWRTPSLDDNDAFIGNPPAYSYAAGTPAVGTFNSPAAGGAQLPAAGKINFPGDAPDSTTTGNYWLSFMFDTYYTRPSLTSLEFSSSSAATRSTLASLNSYMLPVRCVKD